LFWKSYQEDRAVQPPPSGFFSLPCVPSPRNYSRKFVAASPVNLTSLGSTTMQNHGGGSHLLSVPFWEFRGSGPPSDRAVAHSSLLVFQQSLHPRHIFWRVHAHRVMLHFCDTNLPAGDEDRLLETTLQDCTLPRWYAVPAGHLFCPILFAASSAKLLTRSLATPSPTSTAVELISCKKPGSSWRKVLFSQRIA